MQNRFFLAAILGLLSTACTQASQPTADEVLLNSLRKAEAATANFPRSEQKTWDFQPELDTYAPNSLLDLRDLNEKVAGETGFVRRSADGKDFVRGDGQALRFWGVNSELWKFEPSALKDHARFLAKRGVNLVRWHGLIPANTPEAQLTDINKTARDQLWQMTAAMKQQGIYVTISPYWATSNKLKSQPSWGIPRDSDSFTGLLFFDPKLQTAYKQWLRQLLVPVNPYTGVALKDEAAIALIHLQNEDSLLFWTLSKIKGGDLDILSRHYAQWLKQKYGSLAAASDHWKGARVKGDDFEQDLVRLYPTGQMSRPAPENTGKGKRLADQTQFLTETMYRFNQEMRRFLREDIGAKQLINGGNWRTANTLHLNDAERYSYTPTDVIGVNSYYKGAMHQGKHRVWAIVNGDRFQNRSILFHPRDLPLNLKQIANYPMIISESNWVPPLAYQSEAPFLVSAYRSLTGVDGFYWFQTRDTQWRQPSSANGYLPSLGKWVISTPEILGNFPAAALMYRKGYLKQGQPIVQEKRSLQDLWERRLPLISEEAHFPPDRERQYYNYQLPDGQAVNPLAFLVGPVQVSYGPSPSNNQILDLRPYIDQQAQVIRSITGELVWDYGKGIATVNSPKAQGVSGFLKGNGEIQLEQVAIASKNDYATILVVSLDGLAIAESQELLVQAGTVARPSGWQQRPISWKDKQGKRQEGLEILNFGQAPWKLIRNQTMLTINNPNLSEATPLDMNGMPQGTVEIIKNNGVISFSFPSDAKYLLLRGSLGE